MKRMRALWVSGVAVIGCMLLQVSCGVVGKSPEVVMQETVEHLMKQAQDSHQCEEARVVDYIEVARESMKMMGSKTVGEEARKSYNMAAAEMTVLLRQLDHGKRWNREHTVRSGSQVYRIRYERGGEQGVWDPEYFSQFTPAEKVHSKVLKMHRRREGIGGALVGVRKEKPGASMYPECGVAAAVTSLIEIKGQQVRIKLVDPSKVKDALIGGKKRVVEADFSAPLAYYPDKNEWVEGLRGALKIADVANKTGLYLLEPYDRNKIPLVFVHGLISTPRMWRRVIDELERDPELRDRYQCLVFGYPTGNPILYSAMRLREDLGRFYQLHPEAKSAVLVGHSMGGILARAQVSHLRREDWNVLGKEKMKVALDPLPADHVVKRSMVFEANPRVGRVIFICSPHQGSEMALGSIGNMAMKMISLPSDLASTMATTLGSSLGLVTGSPKRLPNSIFGLSPKNPTLQLMSKQPLRVPFHSIIGDRGKGDSPNSSDGVVKYWSSHVSGAQSEKIIPGPHGACEMPETIAELRRILRLNR